MSESIVMLVPLLVLVASMLFPVIGCTGEDPDLAYDRGKKEGEQAGRAAGEQAGEQKGKAEAEKEQQAQAEQEKYFNVIAKEPHLMSYWRLSEGETGGTAALDSAPGLPNNPGEYKNSAGGGVSRAVPGILSIITDTGDQCAEFDGIKGYVEVPHDPAINPPLDFSLECWIRPAALTVQPQVVLALYEVDPSGNLTRGAVLEVHVDVGGTNRIRGRVGYQTGFTAIEASLESGSEHDGWRHIVLTYSNAEKSLKLYVNADNGAPDAQMPPAAGGTPVFYVANTSMPLRIAAGQTEQPAPSPAPAQFFQGRIDEVALYNWPLDGATVKDHFLRGVAVPS